MKPLGHHASIIELMEDFNLTIPPARLPKWRLTFPNVGELDGFPHFGRVYIMATDGVEALYHIDESGQLFKGHLKAFSGAVAKEYVWDDDWNFEARKRKVNIFRRSDGSIVVIPTDHTMDRYWSKHQRLSEEEQNVYAAFGNREITVADMLESLERLCASGSAATKVSHRSSLGPKVKSKRQLMLESL